MKMTFQLLLFLTFFTSTATASTLEEFHASVAAKYGHEANQVTVDKLAPGDHHSTVDRFAKEKHEELVRFAENLQISDKFSYKMEGDYWRVTMPDQKKAYTYQIGIYKYGKASANFHCLVLLNQSGRNGVALGCGAYDIQ